MSYKYPVTTYKPVEGPQSFNFLIGFSDSEAKDILFLSTFDPNFHVVISIKDGNIISLPNYEKNEFNPYRIMVSTTKGLNKNGIEDDIIDQILGLY